MSKQRKTSDGRYVLQKGEYERKGQKGFMYKWRDAYGIQCSISALTLRELREKETEVKIGQLEGRLSSQQRKTVNDFYNLWLSQKRRTQIKQNVLSNYVYMYDRFVAKSRLGKMAVKDVKKSDVKKLYGDLLDKGLAVSTIDNGVHTVLHQVFQVAVDDDVIRKNPSDGVMKEIKATVPKNDPKALTVEEQKRFLDFIKGTVWEPVFTTMLRTGMRVAEISALRWDDIDDKFIHVAQNFIYYRDNLTERHKGDLKMERRIQSTKTTAGDRLLPLNDELRRVLKIQKEEGRPNTDEIPSDVGVISGFVFANREGKCYNQNSLNRALKRIQAEANSEPNVVLLPNLHCHMLRKTYCTNLARADVPLVVASKLMGHSDIEVTARIYTEVQRDMAISADAKLQEYLESENSEHSEKIVKKSE